MNGKYETNIKYSMLESTFRNLLKDGNFLTTLIYFLTYTHKLTYTLLYPLKLNYATR